MLFKLNISCALFLYCFSSAGIALTNPVPDRLIVTNCMYNKLKDKVSLIYQSNGYSLIETELNNAVLHTVHENRKTCGKFLNLDSYYSNSVQSNLDLPQLIQHVTQNNLIPAKNTYPINHRQQVEELYQHIDPQKIWQTNQHLTSYLNRSARSDTGVAAAQWFKQQFDTLAQEYGRSDVESYFVTTGKKYPQPSTVTIIGKDKTKEAIIIGAHIDTLDGNMPGADDDSSGISVAMEISRVLLASRLTLDHPVYIIAYAAEERGLVGSSYVVKHFLNKKIPVKAVMQLDQAGFRANPKDKTIWLLQDYVDADLTQFTAQLLTQYLKIPVAYTRCGYACSDHANWTIEGFKASYPSATTLDDDNPYVHTSEDKLEIINLEHMVNFTKLGLAFVAELGLN